MVTVKDNGRAEFRLLAPDARRVQIVGSFTGWLNRPLEMAPSGDGWWRLSACLPAGEHRFRYLVDGRRWLTDFAAFGVAPNNFGQFDSVLVVATQSESETLPIAAA